jgi:hypothetical protein
MRYFDSNDGRIYSTKVNFVDDNNVLVGYDFSGQCCENYGWYIRSKVTLSREDSLFDETTDINAINESLKEWAFDTSFFAELSDGKYDQENAAVFRLVNGENELFLHLYNIHNGYYSHGFDFSKDGEIIQSGSL